MGGKSSVSSKAFGAPMSADGQMIHRDENMFSDMGLNFQGKEDHYRSDNEHSYQHLQDAGSGESKGFGDPKSGSDNGTSVNLRNLTSPADAIGSIGKRMLLQENSSSNQFRDMQGMEPIGEEMYAGLDADDIVDHFMDPLKDQREIIMEDLDMETPEVDLELFHNLLKSESGTSEVIQTRIRKPRKLIDMLEVDSELFIDSVPPGLSSSQDTSEQDDKLNIEGNLEKNFK